MDPWYVPSPQPPVTDPGDAISYDETWPQRSPSGPDRPEGGSMGKVIFGFLLEKVWRWLVRIFG